MNSLPFKTMTLREAAADPNWCDKVNGGRQVKCICCGNKCKKCCGCAYGTQCEAASCKTLRKCSMHCPCE